MVVSIDAEEGGKNAEYGLFKKSVKGADGDSPASSGVCSHAVKEECGESVGSAGRNIRNRAAFCLVYVWALVIGAAGAAATRSGGFVDHLWEYVSQTSTVIVSVVAFLYAAIAPVVAPVFISPNASLKPGGVRPRFAAGLHILGLTGFAVLVSGLLQGEGGVIGRIEAVGHFFVTPGCVAAAALIAAYCAWSPAVWPTGASIRRFTARSHGRHTGTRPPSYGK